MAQVFILIEIEPDGSRSFVSAHGSEDSAVRARMERRDFWGPDFNNRLFNEYQIEAVDFIP
jgi:hypothetical protein